MITMTCVYYTAVSLDGFIAESDDALEWLTEYEPVAPPANVDVEGPEFPASYEEFYGGVGAMVSGSVTYEWVLAHVNEWPYPGKPFWVLTSRELAVPFEDQDIRFNGTFEEMIASAGEGKLWVVGGGGVASQFAEAGLLDEVIVTVVPVALGAGKPLFDRRLPGPPMQLTGVFPRKSGMVELRYARLPA
jgi:dihydrofolate reductase